MATSGGQNGHGDRWVRLSARGFPLVSMALRRTVFQVEAWTDGPTDERIAEMLNASYCGGEGIIRSSTDADRAGDIVSRSTCCKQAINNQSINQFICQLNTFTK